MRSVVASAPALAALALPAQAALDGHACFAAAMDDWSRRVESFLRRVGAAR